MEWGLSLLPCQRLRPPRSDDPRAPLLTCAAPGWHSGAVKRLSVVVMCVLLVLTGCARQAPVPPPSAAAPTPAVLIGTTDDPTTKLLAELYTQALQGKGRDARIVSVEDDPSQQVARLKAGEVDLIATYAWTAAQALDVDTTEPDALVSDLAAALDGEVAVLQPSGIDRAWRYVTKGSAGSLAELPRSVPVLGSTRWRTAPDGAAGLTSVYRTTASIRVVDEAADRLDQLDGDAVAAFEATDPQAADASVTALDDPQQMVSADPQVAFLRMELSSDDTVLDVVQQLHNELTTDAVVGLRTSATAVGVTEAVATWLRTHPLA